MKISLVQIIAENAHIFKNFYPLYLYDLAEMTRTLPNEHGIFETEPVRTLADQGEEYKTWIEKPGILYPFLITVDDLPAGFILIATPPYVRRGISCVVNEFFLLRQFRGHGIGHIVARNVLDRFRGRWELYVLPSNTTALAFWRTVLTEYVGDQFEEKIEDGPYGGAVTFSFSNQ